MTNFAALSDLETENFLLINPLEFIISANEQGKKKTNRAILACHSRNLLVQLVFSKQRRKLNSRAVYLQDSKTTKNEQMTKVV